MNEYCQNCGKRIAVQIFRGGDWCSELCRKSLEIKANSVTRHFLRLSDGLPICTPPIIEDFVQAEYGPGRMCEDCRSIMQRWNSA